MWKENKNTFSNVDMDNIAYECDPCTLTPNYDPKNTFTWDPSSSNLYFLPLTIFIMEYDFQPYIQYLNQSKVWI